MKLFVIFSLLLIAIYVLNLIYNSTAQLRAYMELGESDCPTNVDINIFQTWRSRQIAAVRFFYFGIWWLPLYGVVAFVTADKHYSFKPYHLLIWFGGSFLCLFISVWKRNLNSKLIEDELLLELTDVHKVTVEYYYQDPDPDPNAVEQKIEDTKSKQYQGSLY